MEKTLAQRKVYELEIEMRKHRVLRREKNTGTALKFDKYMEKLL